MLSWYVLCNAKIPSNTPPETALFHIGIAIACFVIFKFIKSTNDNEARVNGVLQAFRYVQDAPIVVHSSYNHLASHMCLWLSSMHLLLNYSYFRYW
jgi:hypothetical protein